MPLRTDNPTGHRVHVCLRYHAASRNNANFALDHAATPRLVPQCETHMQVEAYASTQLPRGASQGSPLALPYACVRAREYLLTTNHTDKVARTHTVVGCDGPGSTVGAGAFAEKREQAEFNWSESLHRPSAAASWAPYSAFAESQGRLLQRARRPKRISISRAVVCRCVTEMA